MSDTDDTVYFSLISNSTISTSRIRKSYSLDNLLAKKTKSLEKATDNEEEPRSRKGLSQERINWLAQPKRLNKMQYISLAEQVYKYETDTPKRFRSIPKMPSKMVEKAKKAAQVAKMCIASCCSSTYPVISVGGNWSIMFRRTILVIFLTAIAAAVPKLDAIIGLVISTCLTILGLFIRD